MNKQLGHAIALCSGRTCCVEVVLFSVLFIIFQLFETYRLRDVESETRFDCSLYVALTATEKDWASPETYLPGGKT